MGSSPASGSVLVALSLLRILSLLLSAPPPLVLRLSLSNKLKKHTHTKAFVVGTVHTLCHYNIAWLTVIGNTTFCIVF